MDTIFENWRRRLETTRRVAQARGCSPCALTVGDRATEADVVLVERQLGRALPASFRRVLLGFAGHFQLTWFLPNDAVPPEPFEIWSGSLGWDLARLPALGAEVAGWARDAAPDRENAYHRVWHGKLGFHEVGNGDYLALDTEALDADGPVLYLSHDGGDGHGHVLGSNFIDTVDRLIRVGCVGAEDVQWLPFTSSRSGGIEPDGENGRIWREWFGLP
jgi:hypothetical protein